ncbi:hypothetical protein QBC40DRAFT_303153 [Triangularia verruculosa]|uniref:Uncharacterized protein n=1 Tax=Triangularia verruculosa TaxID=2587418 RepID=A0AAN6XQQ1_9PEZI|nr:hypothetical protein QBC40DRAFT_303153 [Triangularia verruculosa]
MEDDTVYKNVQFRSRCFTALAKRIYANRHVFLLTVPPNPITCWLSSWTPQLVRSWLQRMLPEWFLPTTVILKERNPQKADSYENEVDTYRHLQSLQGRCIPLFFGEVAIRNHEQTRYQISKRPVPAILLGDVKGVSLHCLQAEELGDPRLLEKLQAMYDLLTEKGVVHGDPALHNFLYVDGRIVALDFEFPYPLPNDITNADDFETLKDEIQRQLEQAQLPNPGLVTHGAWERWSAW